MAARVCRTTISASFIHEIVANQARPAIKEAAWIERQAGRSHPKMSSIIGRSVCSFDLQFEDSENESYGRHPIIVDGNLDGRFTQADV